MPLEVGLKLWNTNLELFAEAKMMHDQGIIQLIELYMVPGHFDQTKLETLRGIPVRIHAPHENHNFNIFTATTEQVAQFRQESVAVADFFDSPSIVVHASVGTDGQVFKQQLAKLNDHRITIENMPFYSLDHKQCYGYSLEQLTFIHDDLHRPICLDLGHAVKSALSQDKDYKEFIAQVTAAVAPTYFHISDGDPSNDVDEHLNLGTGTYDVLWMKQQLLAIAQHQPVQVIFEVPKNGRDLANDRANITFFNRL